MYLKITPQISCKMRFKCPLSRRRILALVQGLSSLKQQKGWLASFPYTGTKKWPQWCEIWEGPLPANPAGLGAVLLSHSHPPCQLLQAGGCHSREGVFSTGTGCCWRVVWPQEEKHSLQWWMDLGQAPFRQKGSKDSNPSVLV